LIRAASSALLIAVSGICACDAGQHRIPTNHRAAPDTCSTSRPAFMPGPPTDGGGLCSGFACSCTSDSLCTDFKNGRCGQTFELNYCSRSCPICTYDHCFSDSDCPPLGPGPGVCDCRETLGHGPDTVSQASPNYCLYTNNCRVDSDCTSTGLPFCSPSADPQCGSFVGFFCHTTSDECVDDADCGLGICAWQPDKKHWACAKPGACLDGGA